MQAEIELALGCYRNPIQHSDLLRPQAPLPIQPGVMLELATGKGLEDYPETQRAEISQAALFFVRQVFLAPGSDHYRVLGLRPGDDPDLIKRHYRLLMRLFHPDRDTSDEGWGELYAARLNQAYTVLSDPVARAHYDRQQRPVPALPPTPRPQWRVQPEREARQIAPVVALLLPDTPTKALAWLWLAALLLIGWFYLTQVQPLTGVEQMTSTTASAPVPAPVLETRWYLAETQSEPVVIPNTTPVPVRTEPAAVPELRRKPVPVVQAEVPPVLPRLPRPVEAGGAAQPDPVRQSRPVTTTAQATEPVPASYLPRLVAETRALPVAEPVTQIAQPIEPVVALVQARPTPVVSEPVRLPVQEPVVQPVAAPEIVPVQASPPPAIETAAIETLLTQLQAAYTAGDARRLAGLFAPNGRAQRALGPREIERSYRALFADAEDPVLDFGALQWQKQGDYARGSGPLRVTTEDHAIQEGRVVLELRRQPDGRLLLTGFYHF